MTYLCQHCGENVKKVVEIQHVSQIKDENFHECFATSEDRKNNQKTTCWLPYKGRSKTCTFKHHGNCLIALNDANNSNIAGINFHLHRTRLNTMRGEILLNSADDGSNADIVVQNTNHNMMMDGTENGSNNDNMKQPSTSNDTTSNKSIESQMEKKTRVRIMGTMEKLRYK